MVEQKLPEGWQMVKFGDIAKHISKRIEPSETDLEIYVGLEHLEPDSLKIKRHGVPADVEGQKLLVRKGQIIFGKRRAYQRKIAVADWDCICSAHAMVLEANHEMVIPEFLSFFMQSDIFMNRAVSISEGSLSPTIKWKSLSEQKFCIPSKQIQQVLVDISNRFLSSELALNSAINSARILYDVLANKHILGGNNYGSLFGEETRIIPKGWKLVKLGDVLTRIQYGTSEALYDIGDIPVLRMMNIEDGKITNSELKYSKLNENEIKSLKLKKGDILFNRTNSIDLVGKTGLFTLEGDYAFASYMLRLNVKTNLVTPEFVNNFLNLSLIQYRLKAYATPGVSQANINPSSLKSLPFLLPPLNKIKETDKLLDEMKESIRSLILKHTQQRAVQRTLRELRLKG